MFFWIINAEERSIVIHNDLSHNKHLNLIQMLFKRHAQKLIPNFSWLLKPVLTVYSLCWPGRPCAKTERRQSTPSRCRQSSGWAQSPEEGSGSKGECWDPKIGNISRYRIIHLCLISVGEKDLEKFLNKYHLLYLRLFRMPAPSPLPGRQTPHPFTVQLKIVTFALKPSWSLICPFPRILGSACLMSFPGSHCVCSLWMLLCSEIMVLCLQFFFSAKEKVCPSDTHSQIFLPINLPSPSWNNLEF